MYFIAADIPEKRQRALLLYQAGPEVREIYQACGETDTEKTFESTSTILTQYFTDKKNLSFERFQFRSAHKQEDENCKTFIIRLKKLANSCDFHKYSPEDAIVDQFITCCRSTSLRRKLLSTDNLDLDTLIKKASMMELVDTQASVMENGGDSETINALRGRPKPDNQRQCYGCGGFDHNINSEGCPARGKPCYICGNTGHYSKFCFKRKGKGSGENLKAVVETEDSDEEYLF